MQPCTGGLSARPGGLPPRTDNLMQENTEKFAAQTENLMTGLAEEIIEKAQKTGTDGTATDSNMASNTSVGNRTDTDSSKTMFTTLNIGIALIFIALLVMGGVWLMSHLKKKKKRESKQKDVFDLESKGKAASMISDVPVQPKVPFKN